MSQPTALVLGDRILLCSDGMWSPLANDEIVAALTRDASPGGLEPLLREAEGRAGDYADNLSYVVVAVEDDAAEDGIEIDTACAGRSRHLPRAGADSLRLIRADNDS